MASISSFIQFSCKPIAGISKSFLIPAKAAILSANTAPSRPFPALGLASAKGKFAVRASEEGDWGEEVAPGGLAVAEDGIESSEVVTETDVLKKQLVDSFYGTNRGLAASSETRAEVVELIMQLEAKNPTPAPTEALPLLNGKWVLAYTSFVGLFPLLSRGTLPLITVEEISQTIDSELFTVENSVVFSGPLATTSFSTNAKFEVRSPKRVQIKFEEGVIGTPQLIDSIEFPENVEFLGQKIDLTPFKGLVASLQDTASSVVKSISSYPPLKFSIANKYSESWLLTTYLDDELRISRGDGGSIFVLIKEGSSLLTPYYY
ncbi:unnamed protein product [Cuscuta epithymum]|uniref:Plastid lipid-associated protein/fibrillin conserved domain-containing protein n=1 Tax=Cuscuta epithymum TaxID=186058 RepID=A0AAV0DNP2_9ASTE|nr:unnamed protein product [Cuscuta epithymum]